MGIDLLDVSFRLEKTTGVMLTADDWSGLASDKDIVVGDVYTLLICRLGLAHEIRTDIELNESIWHQVQAAVSRISSKSPVEITMETTLDNLFSKETRRTRWSTLRKELGLGIPHLENSATDQRWISASSLLCILIPLAIFATCVSVAYGRGVTAFVFAGGISLICFLALNAVRLALSRTIWEPRRVCFPRQVVNVKELCRRVRDINAHRLIGRPLSKDLDDGRKIWIDLKAALVDALGVDDEEITMQARLIKDLGAE
ncbi:MAG: hypothetical protein O2856_11895 [Planctomycetota bacterium]|nr:hypothetical protein [Planctomycetota bacterium]